MSLLLLFTAVLPVILFFILIYYRDKEKEPIPILVKAFAGGLGAAILTLIFTAPINYIELNSRLLDAFFQAFITAAIPEEIAKYIFLYLIIWHNKNFDQYYDGIVYAVMVSLGFAFIENLFYVYSGGLRVAVSRALLAIPLHGFTGVTMGYYFSLAKFEHNRKYLIKAIAYAILIHGIYDFIAFYSQGQDTVWSIVLFLIFVVFNIRLWKFGLNKVRNHVAKDRP